MRDSIENAMLCHLEFHNNSLLRGLSTCRPYADSLSVVKWGITVLVDIEASGLPWTCHKMSKEGSCIFVTISLRTFPSSNHLCHSRCTVDTCKYLSSAIRLNCQFAFLSPNNIFLVYLFVWWKCLRCLLPCILYIRGFFCVRNSIWKEIFYVFEQHNYCRFCWWLP